MKKRILALVLSVAMVLSFVPFSAFADGESTNANEVAIFNVPEASSDIEGDWSPVIIPEVRKENGENFVVIDGTKFDGTRRYATLYTTKMTYGDEANGLPISKDITSAELSTRYVAIRMKVYDKGEYEKNYTLLQLYISRNKVLAEDGSVLVEGASNRLSSKKSTASNMYWMDAKDGSITNTWSYVNSTNGCFGFTGNLDGWLLVPAGTEDKGISISEDHYKYLKGVQFYFEKSSTAKEFNWDDIEFLIGDIDLVTDMKTFQADKIKEYEITKYAPNKGEDGAYYAFRAFGARHYQYGSYGKSVTKTTAYAESEGSGSPVRSYLHKAAMVNGDAAYAFSLNTSLGYKTGGGAATLLQTYDYDFSWDSERVAKPGIPEDIDLSKMNAVAYRVATNGGKDTDTNINFTISPRRLNDPTATNSTQKRVIVEGKLATGTVTYIDAITREVSQLPVAEDGSITITKDIDGWIIADMTQYGEFFIDPETNQMKTIFQTAWGGSYNAYNSETVAGATKSEAIGCYLNTGFENGKTFYLGDMFFVEDAEKFQAYHTDCAKIGHEYVETAREDATCTEAGSVTYTCQRTNCPEKTKVEELPALDHAWVEVKGQDATCTNDGYVESYCERNCGVENKIDVIPATGKHIASETATPAGDDANHNYLCTVCTQTITTEPCTYVEDEAQKVEPQIGVAGKKVFVCSVCGDEKEEEIPALEAPKCEHAEYTIINAIDAKCGEAGYSGDKKCNACGEVFEMGGPTAALEHDQDTVIKGKDATCTEAGLTDGAKCSKCGLVQVEQKEIPATGHTKFGEDGWVDVKEVCGNECGTVLYDLEALLKTGEATLEYNVSVDKAIVIDYETTLNLNGKTMALSGLDTSGDGIFWVKKGGVLTINGEGELNSAGNNSGYKMALWADGGKIIINGGTYTNNFDTTDPQYDLIYVKNGGEITINGGEFICATPKWTLNSHNDAKGTFFINGGKYYEYDPSNIDTDEGFTSWVAPSVYDVVKDGNYYTLTAHTCKYEAKETVAPTATESGYTFYECKCGVGYKADYVMPLDSEVKNVKADQITETMDLKVTWDAIDGADMYLVYVYDAEGTQVRGATVTNGNNTVRIDGFKVGTYTVKVRARVGGKYTAKYDGVEVTFGSILPEAPEVTVVSTDKNSITVKWNAVEGAVKYFVKVEGANQAFTPGTTDTELTITGLKVNTEYKISINVKFGTAVYTGYVEKATAKTDAHADIEITATKGDDGIVVAWDVTNDNDTANKYWVKRVDAEGNVTQIAVTTATSIVAKDVEGANTFYIIARVKDANGTYRYVTSEVAVAQ